MRTILVLTGSTKAEDVERFPYRPTRVANSIAEVVELVGCACAEAACCLADNGVDRRSEAPYVCLRQRGRPVLRSPARMWLFCPIGPELTPRTAGPADRKVESGAGVTATSVKVVKPGKTMSTLGCLTAREADW